MGVLARLIQTRTADRSGQSDVLAAHATGLAPALLDAAVAHEGGPEGGARLGRRGRGLDRAEDVLADQLGQKLLGYWLQNRHQVLFPLTVNLRTVDAAHGALLAQWSAAVLQAVVPADARAGSDQRRWLKDSGADDALLAIFDAAEIAPPALGTLLIAIGAEPGLAGHAYVAALVAIGQREPGARFFLEFVANRLALPSTVIRSANRRFAR